MLALENDPDLRSLRSIEGEQDPFFILRGSGGSRAGLPMLVLGMLDAAYRRQLFAHLPLEEESFVSAVLERLAELRRAVQGDMITVPRIFGLAGVTLPLDARLNLPWGSVSPVPQVRIDAQVWSYSPSTAMLVAPFETSVLVSRAADPAMEVLDPVIAAREDAIHQLVPVAFALATAMSTPCAPIISLSADLHPFGSGFGASSPLLPPMMATPMLSREDMADVEHWAQVLDSQHHPSLDVATRRVVTAISLRADPADALIDAVTAWESLVGTRSETMFRVTAGLAKLLEADGNARQSLKKRLTQIYDTRSRLVHGDVVDAVQVQAGGKEALSVALKAIRALHERGGDWLTMKSSARSERLLLDC